MKTEMLQPTEQGIARAGEILRSGGLVGIPTETVYGLAADALNGEAVAGIFKAKGRPQDNPLIVHICSFEQIKPLVSSLPASARALAEAYWPGPLTMVLPKAACIPEETSAGLDTVAVRFPSHPVARAVIQAAGTPLAAPSANLSGSPSPTTARHVLDDMEGRIPAIVDGGPCEVGVESTVVTLATEKPRLLRPGGITLEQLEAVLGEVEVDPAVLHQLKEGAKASSPGMKYKHYAPKAHVVIVEGNTKQYMDYVNARAGEGVCALCYNGEEAGLRVPAVSYGAEFDYSTQAHRLFEVLRELDEMGARQVYARCPRPEGVGMAVYNRLIRAAGFEVIRLKPFILGLTGPTGAGKSAAAAGMKARGCAVIDADQLARKAVEPGSPALSELAAAFGPDILDETGALNRALLAQRAFVSSEATQRLNRITHPYIIRLTEEEIRQYAEKGVPLIVLDAPLLYESGMDRLCDAVAAVIAPKQTRLERIMRRDGISRESALLRMSAQNKDEFYTDRARYVLYADTNRQDLYRQAGKLADQLREAHDGTHP